jgi:hypothetical protein
MTVRDRPEPATYRPIALSDRDVLGECAPTRR